MKIQSYKNRKINYHKPVQVYRCLNRRGFVFSIKQGSYVVAHTSEITLNNVSFHVGETGRERCLKEKQRNVHAWVIGTINDSIVECDSDIYYNPYKTDSFILSKDGSKIDHTDFLTIKNNKISIQ